MTAARPKALIRATSTVGLWQLLDTLRAPRMNEASPTPSTRYEHDARMGYSATELVSYTAEADGTRTVRSSVLGLLGTEAIVPVAVTEAVISADDGGATRAFFDAIHGRFLEAVHSAWQQLGPHGTTHRALRTFVGEDVEESEELFSVGVSDVIRCTPEYLDPAALDLLLARTFPELGARVSLGDPEFVPAMESDRPELGVRGNVLGAEMAYGLGAWDPVGTARITTRERSDVSELLPGGATYERLRAFAEKWLPRYSVVVLEVPMRGEHATWATVGGQTGSVLGFDMPMTARTPDRVRMHVPLVTDRERVTVRYTADE